ncbi:MAG: hypothetical protein ACK47M_20230, partial [Caldilinea sp.]
RGANESALSCGFYLQWQEDNIPPQVVFEAPAAGDAFIEMNNKLRFYRQWALILSRRPRQRQVEQLAERLRTLGVDPETL